VTPIEGFSRAYQRYMASDEWRQLRTRKIAEVGRCQDCGATDRLEAHHLTYERFGHERPEDLQVLCHFCHMSEHGRGAHGVGPVAGLTIEQQVMRGHGPDLVRHQQSVAAVAEIEDLVQRVERLRAKTPSAEAQRMLRRAARSLEAAARGLARTREEADARERAKALEREHKRSASPGDV